MSSELRQRKPPQPPDNDDSTDGGMSDGARDTDEPAPKPAAHSKGENKSSKVKKRLIFGSLLLVFLCCIIAAGHVWTLGLVLFAQVAMFRELVNVRYSYRKFKDVPLFRTSQWGWFFACLLYSYGNSFLSPDRRSLITSLILLKCLPYVEIITLLMYSTMLMLTVLTLTKGYYKYQVGQLAWTIAIIVITVVQVHSFTANVLNGLFWFLFPVSLVICNDSMAYFCGMAYGRRFINKRFLELSPNKTWEGFIGGGFCTVLFAFATPVIYAQMPFLICPADELNPFSFDTLSLTCDTPKVFVPTAYKLTWLTNVMPGGAPTIELLPIQLHALSIGLFASVVAPFGGFFASGIKRAYKLDDFASIIPGHGGVFDRVDCQLITGLATQTYYATFIGPSAILSVKRVLQLAASLAAADQLQLYKQLGQSLKTQGLLR